MVQRAMHLKAAIARPRYALHISNQQVRQQAHYRRARQDRENAVHDPSELRRTVTV